MKSLDSLDSITNAIYSHSVLRSQFVIISSVTECPEVMEFEESSNTSMGGSFTDRVNYDNMTANCEANIIRNRIQTGLYLVQKHVEICSSQNESKDYFRTRLKRATM